MKQAFVITCEHASNYVPVRWRAPFRDTPGVLLTHRAWDPGALLLAQEFADKFKAPLFKGQVTRLLVDLNRHVESDSVFSEFSRKLGEGQRKHLLHTYHWPFRVAVLDAVTEFIRRGHKVLHLSCHSFTPVLDGKTRNAEVGLLFDPRRKPEAALCGRWQKALSSALPGHRVRPNYPYKGTSDGMTTWLRGQFPTKQYAGIEIELNQSFAMRPDREWANVRRALMTCLKAAL